MEGVAVEELQKEADAEDGDETADLDQTCQQARRVDLGIDRDVLGGQEVYLDSKFICLGRILRLQLCATNGQSFVLVYGSCQLFEPDSVILLVLFEFDLTFNRHLSK